MMFFTAFSYCFFFVPEKFAIICSLLCSLAECYFCALEKKNPLRWDLNSIWRGDGQACYPLDYSDLKYYAGYWALYPKASWLLWDNCKWANLGQKALLVPTVWITFDKHSQAVCFDRLYFRGINIKEKPYFVNENEFYSEKRFGIYWVRERKRTRQAC